MNIEQRIAVINMSKDLPAAEIEQLWVIVLNGDSQAFNQLKQYYMKSLLKIKPLYGYLDDVEFYNILEKSVDKALERGTKFQIDNIDAYMVMASQTYFKYFLQPTNENLQLPMSLLKAFAKLEEVYQHLPILLDKDDQEQIQLLAKGFEYPLFHTRMLYFSYIKWKNNNLRQVDIDLTVTLLPPPKRVEWEIFYEKPIEQIEETIRLEIAQ